MATSELFDTAALLGTAESLLCANEGERRKHLPSSSKISRGDREISLRKCGNAHDHCEEAPRASRSTVENFPMSTNQEPLLVSVQEAVRFSGISRSTLYRHLAAGDIRARKVGRSTRVETASLRDFVGQLPEAEFRCERRV